MNGVLKLLAACVLVVAGFGLFGGDAVSYRYRLTIEADTPDGVRAASGVLHVDSWETKWGFPEARGVSHHVSGDAVFLDLGRGKNLIALLTHGERGEYVDGIGYMALRAFQRARPNVQWNMMSAMAGRVSLDGDLVPTLITFVDLKDPKTAGVVALDGFEQAFGTGYRFRGASIEMVPVGWWPLNIIGITGAQITRGIEKRFAWFGQRQPWMREISPGVYVDTRTDAFKITNQMLKRDP